MKNTGIAVVQHPDEATLIKIRELWLKLGQKEVRESDTDLELRIYLMMCFGIIAVTVGMDPMTGTVLNPNRFPIRISQTDAERIQHCLLPAG